MPHNLVGSRSLTTIMLAGLLLGLVGALCAQPVYISKYIPGNPLNQQDLNHRIELFNESETNYVDLSGYTIVTRQYIVRLPENTFVQALRSIKLGKLSSGGNLDYEYLGMKDFMVRIPSGGNKGDFALLYDPFMNIVDAFYFSDQRKVSFLPANEEFMTYRQESISVSIPDETDSRWTFLQSVPDPAMSFVRINGAWQPNSRRTNLLPATKYRFLQPKYVDGIVTVRWKTLFERDCYFHLLERSTDGKDYQLLERKKGPQNSGEPYEYVFYDKTVQKDRVYYYRIQTTDKFGNIVSSNPAKVRTEENPGGFTFDIIRDNAEAGTYLNIRFAATESQKVRVKIMDEEFREIAVLYYGVIDKNKQNLVNYTEPLSIGKYYVIVATEKRRYYEPFIVE